VALHREVGNQSAEAGCWHSLGYALHHLGRHDEAIECFERAVDMCVGLGEVYYLSMAYTHLGDAQQAAGDAAAARRSWQQALTILEDLAHPDAAGLRRRLTVV
jgi:tetratricopeptide (TPR) repeat protein